MKIKKIKENPIPPSKETKKTIKSKMLFRYKIREKIIEIE